MKREMKGCEGRRGKEVRDVREGKVDVRDAYGKGGVGSSV